MSRVVQELVDSDRRYVCQLSVLVNGYISVLRRQDAGWKRILAETKDIAVLFLYIDQIYLLSSQFFELLCSDTGLLHVLNTVQSFSLLFRLYAQYASIYTQATAALEKLCRSCPPLKTFLDEQEKAGAVRMEALLITPIQRLPRYELLVKEMLNCMDANDPLVEPAEAAIRCVQKANAFVNESILRKEMRHELLALQRRFNSSGTNTVILGNGVDRVVKQGVISVRQCQGNSDEVLTVLAILSPKHLTLATQLGDAHRSLRLLVKFHLDKLRLRPQDSSSTRLVVVYNHQYRMQRWELYYVDKATKEEWEAAINSLMPDMEPMELVLLETATGRSGADAYVRRNNDNTRLDRLLKEVSISEKRFSDDLRLLVDCFVQPLLDAVGCNNLALICSDLSASEKGYATKMFALTDSHLMLHCLLQLRILHEGIAARFADLERRHERSVDVCAEAFNALFPLLKLYDSYHARIEPFGKLFDS